jgi:hypothetical protein
VAERGLGASTPLALPATAGGPAGLRVWARQIVDGAPSRPLVTPGVRQPPAVHGIPRAG